MTAQFPPSNVPPTMQPFARAVENSIHATENTQENTGNIVRSMRQSIASNYGLGGTLTNNAGSLSNKVYSSLQNVQNSPAATTVLQRSWTNLGNSVTITSAPFLSNVALGVSAAVHLDVLGGVAGATYAHWLRINVTGDVSGNKVISRTDFPQELFFWDSVPTSSSITLRLQVWGYIQNPDTSVVNGSITTASVLRIASALRATALV